MCRFQEAKKMHAELLGGQLPLTISIKDGKGEEEQAVF